MSSQKAREIAVKLRQGAQKQLRNHTRGALDDGGRLNLGAGQKAGVLPAEYGGTSHELGAQPPSDELTAIAALAPTDGDVIQRVSGAWLNRTLAQLKTALGLDNVDNTSDATKNAATVTLTNKTLTADKHDSYSDYAEIASPATPPSATVRVYAKSDGLIYIKDDAGVETALGGGGGGGGALAVEEVDGSPTDSAVTKIVFPNGTLGIASHVATYTPPHRLSELGYVQSTDTTNRTHTSRTAADVNALSLTIDCPATEVAFELQIGIYGTTSARWNFILYDVTGSAVVAATVAVPSSNDSVYRHTFRITPAASGSRTYKVQVRNVDTPATLNYRAFPTSGVAPVVPYSLRAVG
jgi:hypothetical protein